MFIEPKINIIDKERGLLEQMSTFPF